MDPHNFKRLTILGEWPKSIWALFHAQLGMPDAQFWPQWISEFQNFYTLDSYNFLCAARWDEWQKSILALLHAQLGTLIAQFFGAKLVCQWNCSVLSGFSYLEGQFGKTWIMTKINLVNMPMQTQCPILGHVINLVMEIFNWIPIGVKSFNTHKTDDYCNVSI